MTMNFADASLLPPDHGRPGPPDDAGSPGSCAMLDVQAYIADRRNATTAYGQMSNGVEIQVTFCLAPPPVISYLCIWCPETQDLIRVATEPSVIAAEADLVVFSVGVGPGFTWSNPRLNDIFVYHAPCGEKGPWLRRLPHPDHDSYSLYFNIGLFRLVGSNTDDDHYYVVTLSPAKVPWQFNLLLLCSKTEAWRCKIVSLGRQHRHSQFYLCPSKVIILGEGGLVGFVDLWRGILVCNVLDCHPQLHYIPLPRRLKDTKKPDLNPVIARDVAVVKGRIKVVDCFRRPTSSGWKVSVWSRPSNSLEEDWNMDYKLDICDNLVDSNTLHFELLPKLLKGNGDGAPLQTLERLHISHPRLSLDDDDIVYFFAKVGPWKEEACVISVDLKNKRMQDVDVFDAERSFSDTLCYMGTMISHYFTTTLGNY